MEEEFENERERKDDMDMSSQLLALELERTRYGSEEWGGLTGGSPFILEALSNLFKNKRLIKNYIQHQRKQTSFLI